MRRWQDDDTDNPGDSAVVGVYLAEFREGLTRDELAEALGWTLLRVERALAVLDSGLHGSGMRLALRADRIVVVGCLDQTELPSRLSLERLTAGQLDPKLARFLWAALDGCQWQGLRPECPPPRPSGSAMVAIDSLTKPQGKEV